MHRTFGRATGTAIVGLLYAAAASAQVPAISYVASIKPNTNIDARGFSEYSAGGRLTTQAVTLGSLLRTAYRIQPYQLTGLPDWIASKRYDIAARVEDSPAPSQQVFLQALLRDHFKLLVHNENREAPIFSLVLARSDGRLGPQLNKSTFDCAAYFAAPHDPPQPGRTPPCAMRIGFGTLSGKAIPMSQLATSLAPFLNRFTIDKTGLTGGFDVELTWTPDQPVSAGGNPAPDISPNAPPLFAAIQEQLGLKLVSEKGQVPVLVVDRVEEPRSN